MAEHSPFGLPVGSASAGASPLKILESLMIGLIRFYQTAISPLFPPSCRFTPTCSQYAVESIRNRGPIVGFYYTIRRLLRCHPWNPGGYDPPPNSPPDG